MVFSSLIFLFLFLPTVLLLYYASPRRIRNLVLFLTSLLFYAWGEPIYIGIMLLSTITDYSFGLLLDQPNRSPRARKRIVASSVIVNLGLLGFFKYADFLIGTVNSLVGTAIPATDLPLPIGISFYTFQSMSYIIDVYRGKTKAQRNWIDFGAFVALFPQLVAGPIVTYNTIAEQLRSRRETFEQFAEGARRFVIGLAKKVLLANNIGLVWDGIASLSPDSLPVFTAWLGLVAFAFQIYFDFSGYSDMAIGLGLMFGFRFRENFNKPYASRSITDFWRRWHISLGTWFRDYVYIPLGGNRHGLAAQLRNILIVWLLTGFWHGASWNFVLWGLYFGFVLSFEKLIWLRWLERSPRFVQHSYAIVMILIGWVFFAFTDLGAMGDFFRALTGLNHQALWNERTLYLLYTNGLLLIMLIGASLPAPQVIRVICRKLPFGLSALSLGLLFFLSVAYLVDASYNPFLYFRF
ncbi:MBOAT family O-acyltransferase [Gorillibacterium timonense]|uniref:MBOAT family O-acyltransferase n=1 Tax=Gorillibacterium timonense TaxID=1689269 RepID=UPI00071E1618|nr:MBOAT family protein [Gorillibacterium timonense]